jgi:hypothetical protein
LSDDLASSAICAEEVFRTDLVCFAGEVIAECGDYVSFFLIVIILVGCKGQQCSIKSSRETLRCRMAHKDRLEQGLGEIDRGAWTRFFIVALTIWNQQVSSAKQNCTKADTFLSGSFPHE